jgi:hypothetical protein
MFLIMLRILWHSKLVMPHIKVLVQRSKDRDDKSFLALIKMHTPVHPFDSKEIPKLIISSLSADRYFYEQKWVQKKLKRERR